MLTFQCMRCLKICLAEIYNTNKMMCHKCVAEVSGYKICKGCGEKLKLSEFRKEWGNNGKGYPNKGYRNFCKACEKAKYS